MPRLDKANRGLRGAADASVSCDPDSPGAAGRRWLLVFNCASIGLGNCIKLQAPGIDIESVDFGRFKADPDAWRERLDAYELIITAPHFLRNDLVDFTEHARTRVLPIVQFDAYHPDLCYISTNGKAAKGPMGDYHSQIVVAAHAKRIPASHARELFTRAQFQAFGFLDRWEAARERLLAGFRGAGIPMDAHFPRWSARSPFMYSINHPAIHVLRDVASALLEAEGVEPVPNVPLPHDNLLNGPVYPVYPDIAEALSVRGSYAFKLATQYRCIGLDEYIARSYALLDALGDHMEVHRAQRASYDRVLANI